MRTLKPYKHRFFKHRVWFWAVLKMWREPYCHKSMAHLTDSGWSIPHQLDHDGSGRRMTTAWNGTDQTASNRYLRPLANGHQISVVGTNQAPHCGIDHSISMQPYHRHLAYGTEPSLPNHCGLGHGTELSTHTQPRHCSFSPECFPIKFSDSILPSSEIDRPV